MQPAAGLPIALTGGATQIAWAGQGTLAGWTVRETGTAALVLRLWDNASAASGIIVAVISIAISTGTDRDFLAGRRFKNGLFVERVGTGAYEGTIWLA